MIEAVALTVAFGTATYVWLTATARPLLMGARATLRVWWGDGWRYALPLALGVTALATFVPVAALVLVTMSAPTLWLYVTDTPWLRLGALIGAGVWAARAAAAGAPRLPVDLEVALALAVVALTQDDGATLSRVERRDHQHMLTDPVEVAHRAGQWHAA